MSDHVPPARPARSTASSLVPADLERRFGALVLDRVLGWGLVAIITAVAAVLGDLGAGACVLVALGSLVVVGTVSGVLVGTAGTTPGKALLGLRVVGRDGRPIGVLAGLGRTTVLGLAGLPTVGLGWATLAWTVAADPTRQRRGLHDRIGDAVVVDTRPQVEAVEVEDDAPAPIVNLTAMRLMPVEPAPAPAAQPVVEPAARPAPATAARPVAEPAAVPVAAPVTAPPPARIPPPAPAAPPAPVPPAAPLPPAAERTRIRAAAPAAPVGAAPPEGRRRAVWRVSFDTGEQFAVEGLALVGRRPEPRPGEPVRHLVPLPSGDMSVSKTHAQFQVAPDGALVVMDRGSTNGSVLVRKGVSKPLAPGRPATLLDGDVVRFGDRTMTVSRG
ncbi:RDD family protein [Nocardioides sp.]|uniref:RDD family protein n=1 Tax=Nocardioides sp. TaxID=35761 RepID=UPI0035120C50